MCNLSFSLQARPICVPQMSHFHLTDVSISSLIATWVHFAHGKTQYARQRRGRDVAHASGTLAPRLHSRPNSLRAHHSHAY